MTMPTFTDSMSIELRLQLIAEGWTPPCPEMRRFAALGMIEDICRQLASGTGRARKIQISPIAAEILLGESAILKGANGVDVHLSTAPGAAFATCGLDAYLTEDLEMRLVVVFDESTPREALDRPARARAR